MQCVHGEDDLTVHAVGHGHALREPCGTDTVKSLLEENLHQNSSRACAASKPL